MERIHRQTHSRPVANDENARMAPVKTATNGNSRNGFNPFTKQNTGPSTTAINTTSITGRHSRRVALGDVSSNSNIARGNLNQQSKGRDKIKVYVQPDDENAGPSESAGSAAYAARANKRKALAELPTSGVPTSSLPPLPHNTGRSGLHAAVVVDPVADKENRGYDDDTELEVDEENDDPLSPEEVEAAAKMPRTARTWQSRHIDPHQHERESVVEEARSVEVDSAVITESGGLVDENALVREEEEEEQEQDQDQVVPMLPEVTLSDEMELQEAALIYARPNGEFDDDDEDKYDVSMVPEYNEEIFRYLRKLEQKMVPDPYYINNQDELRWEMRGILIEWVVQVHSRFGLLPETLFLAVNYIDRFLSKKKVSLTKFQLVGAVALFIAAKYEEINCPTVQEIAYMVDHGYTVDELLKAERFMIDMLDFEMGWPGPMSFLRRTSKADDYDLETRTLAKYLLEVTIMDERFIASPPSWLAAGAHYLSRKLLSRGEWTKAHVYYSGYTARQLHPLAEAILGCCSQAETHHKAIFEKYQERKFKNASTYVQEWIRYVGRSESRDRD